MRKAKRSLPRSPTKATVNLMRNLKNLKKLKIFRKQKVL